MGLYRNKIFVLIVLLKDGRQATWYFDLNVQADRARDFCHTHPDLVQSFSHQWQEGGVPEGDFISDADEFIDWITCPDR